MGLEIEEKSPATAIRRADGDTNSCWKVLKSVAKPVAAYTQKGECERDSKREKGNEKQSGIE